MSTPYCTVDQMEKVERLVRNAVRQTDLYHLIQVNYHNYLFTIDLSYVVFCVLFSYHHCLSIINRYFFSYSLLFSQC